MKIVDPEIMVHPTRLTMNDDDWERMDRIFVGDSDEDCSVEEIDAYQDYVYDLICAKLQTVPGTTVLQ